MKAYNLPTNDQSMQEKHRISNFLKNNFIDSNKEEKKRKEKKHFAVEQAKNSIKD